MEMMLRPYQGDTLTALREGFIAGHRCQMLYAPTGAGKTEMAIALMSATADKGNRAAMVMDRILLCEQTSARMDKYRIPHGVIQSGHWRWRPEERIQVCSAQTIEKRGSFPGLNLLVCDEAHTTRKETIKFINNHPNIKVIGLSASPFTKGLGATYTNVVSVATTAQLVEWGNLVPLKVYIAKQVDMKGVKKVAGEYAADDAASRGMQITGDVIAEWVRMTHTIFGGPRKTIVFASNVAHGADLAQKFADAGYNFVPISYKDSDDFKRDAVADFSKPDTNINGLIATDILTKGFDCPDVEVGISVRAFAKSLSSHVQQMGRVMRPHPAKAYALWLCHSGNYVRFREEWDDIYHNGVSELKDDAEKPKPDPTDKEKEAARCPKCSALWPRNSDMCAACGHTRVRLNLIEHVEGELVELGQTSNRASHEEKQAWYSQILQHGRDRGWSDGACAHRYRDKFGVWPRGLQDVPRPISPEVGRWLKSRQIAWAKGRKA